ncbi:hypothetical protein BFS86_19550 [Shewanella algae]|jgi:hypothetical protein|nr:hypothetical protein BFS86_19550 [Shewanella algae]DAU40276.1 MAG TPA: hypothetical protein [Caudoviricetes sp.]
MITLTILSGVLTSSLALWLLVLRVDPRYRLYLAVFIPLAFAWPFAVYQYGGSLLGYSIAARIPADFRLVFAYADDKIHTVYALIVEPGASVPRLYAITDNYEQNKKQFAQAQAAKGRGIPVSGTPKKGAKPGKAKVAGVGDDGDFIFYQLPPTGVPDKDAG